MRKLAVIILALFLSGCGAIMPQTRSAFIKSAETHPSVALVAKSVVNRPFDDVVSSLNEAWQRCYNISNVTTRSDNNVTTMRMSQNYHPKLVRVSPNLAEFTLQYSMSGITMADKVPDGGYYGVALNVKHLSPTKTELNWYGALGDNKEMWQRNQNWAAGKNATCS